jgi:EAL domain-containing protein (putative c-di-GMP-specific phosphodiesterase class I)
VSFAENVGALLIAEGIETVAEYEQLRSPGVHHGQGFYMPSRAEPSHRAVAVTGGCSRTMSGAGEQLLDQIDCAPAGSESHDVRPPWICSIAVWPPD